MTKNKVSILVVDDDPDDVFLIEDAIGEIEDSHHDITVANDPDVALSILENKTFDIILSDYRLGATTGIDLIKTIRAKGLSTPIILLTGMSEREVDEQALNAGASDYINKSSLSGPIIDRAIRYALANARRQHLFSSVLANVKAAICVIDEEGKPQIWNSEFLKLSQANSQHETEAEIVAAFMEKVISTDREQLVEAIQHEKKETTLPDGRKVITLHDVSEHVAALHERKIAQEKADRQAKTCFLTGLPNRLAFTERLEQLIDSRAEFCLLNIDLDKFKGYNDVYGHPFGDALLKLVSSTLRRSCGPDDFLARIGGDEFIAIQLKDRDGTRKTKLEDNLCAAFSKDIIVDGRRVNVGVSIGVVRYPEHGETTQSLLANSDIAMYRSKTTDGSHVEYYDSSLDNAVRERRRLIHDLQVAIREETLEVFFQPQFDLKSEEMIGCEALARWTHPEDGPIRPDIFIEIAENCGLIEELGKMILRKACLLAKEWPTPLKVAVNISGVQVRHTDLVKDVQSILLETGLPANRLELEVTETVLIDNFDYALHVLRGIKNLGVDLAMDDFGTGFSSLSSLISFPFDKLKIDRSFVMDMEKREQLKSVIRTCIGLGQNLDLRIVAEGVEQESHVDFLRSEGCDEMQGYFVGKPMPQMHLLEFMENYTGKCSSSEQTSVKKHKVA